MQLLLLKQKNHRMTTGALIGEALLTLQNEKGNICVSVIVPTHRTSPDRRSDKLNTKTAIEKAEQLLKTKYSSDIVSPLMNKLHELFQQIDFDRNEEGLGLFVSSNVQLQLSFPFRVEEKIVVGDSFEIRDVLYKVNYSDPYYVILLTQHGAHLFQGSWNTLDEIKDKHFPMEYEDEYVYNPPSRSMSYAGQAHVKNFEKDKSEMEEIRFKNFFHKVNKLLNGYLLNNEPLIMLGTEKLLALFENVSTHQKHFAGKITGSYSYLNPKQLSELVSPVIFSYLQNKRVKLIDEFVEKVGQHLATSGIQDIWSAAMEGKAFKLLVEKDYRCPGFLDENNYHLYLKPPQKPHIVLADAVDDLIELVLKKEGRVFFVNNGQLKNYDRIALITRY
jgi:hypothetical protein